MAEHSRHRNLTPKIALALALALALAPSTTNRNRNYDLQRNAVPVRRSIRVAQNQEVLNPLIPASLVRQITVNRAILPNQSPRNRPVRTKVVGSRNDRLIRRAQIVNMLLAKR